LDLLKTTFELLAELIVGLIGECRYVLSRGWKSTWVEPRVLSRPM